MSTMLVQLVDHIGDSNHSSIIHLQRKKIKSLTYREKRKKTCFPLSYTYDTGKLVRRLTLYTIRDLIPLCILNKSMYFLILI